MVISKKKRGHGLGRKLMEKTEEAAKRLKCIHHGVLSSFTFLNHSHNAFWTKYLMNMSCIYFFSFFPRCFCMLLLVFSAILLVSGLATNRRI